MRSLPLPGTPRDPLVLSPMVDVTDAAFRSVARDWGADVTCSEMVSAAALVHGKASAWRHVQPWPGERPYGVQFMTGDPEEMRTAVLALAGRLEVDFVDVNLGCPAPNILRSCAGGFLLRDPDRAAAVLRAATAAAQEVGIPRVSAKMRLGPDDGRLTYLEVARAAEAAGCSWVTLHARTVAQGYAGTARWEHIRALADDLSIPVVGNGDLRTPQDVVRMRDETGCAGFFIARAAMHDPTVFQGMRAALEGRRVEEVPYARRLRALLSYLERAPLAGVASVDELRRQAMRFVAGQPGAKALRVELHGCADAAAVRHRVARALAALEPVAEAAPGVAA